MTVSLPHSVSEAEPARVVLQPTVEEDDALSLYGGPGRARHEVGRAEQQHEERVDLVVGQRRDGSQTTKQLSEQLCAKTTEESDASIFRKC